MRLCVIIPSAMSTLDPTLPPVIEVRDVRRAFRSVRKGDGLKGAIRLITRPEYNETEALKGVSFSIAPGAFIGLIGANGAGKTTLLKILSGLIPPTSGEARVMGFDPFTRPLEFRRNISLVMGQKAQLWWDLPAVDAFDLLRAIYDVPASLYKERLQTLAELLDVTRHLNTQIRRLSLGERMKMELIGAILHWPKVIFLDEPTIGLDVFAAHKLREFLKVHNRDHGATIILTSHNMDDIERLCSRVLILRSGELIYDGRPDRLTRRGEIRLRVRLLERIPTATIAEVTGVPESAIQTVDVEEETDPNSGTLWFSIKQDQSVQVLQTLMNRFTVADMGVEEQSLETVIHRLYEEGQIATAAPGGVR